MDKLFEFAEQIPMEELYAEIRKRTGLSDLKFNHRVADSRGAVRIYVESEDIVEKLPRFLTLMFSEMVLSTFNTEVVEKDGKIFWWGSISFRYHHPSGGSNGYNFLTFWYENNSWTFE